MKRALEWCGKRKGLLIPLTAILLVSGILAGTAMGRGRLPVSGAPDGNWGLSFQTEGRPPVGNASEEELAALGAVYRVPTEEKVLYLTFDAGYENGHTEDILTALRKHGAKAVFFLVGNYLETQPELVREMLADGHTVGNHTYSHPDMAAIRDRASFQNELVKNETLFREITGQEMAKLYRPPQGKYSQRNLTMAQELGYTTVFWSLAYVDWLEDDQPTRDEAYAKLLPRMHPGAVVLLHSTSRTNAEILDALLGEWEAMGYRFGDPAELRAE